MLVDGLVASVGDAIVGAQVAVGAQVVGYGVGDQVLGAKIGAKVGAQEEASEGASVQGKLLA